MRWSDDIVTAVNLSMCAQNGSTALIDAARNGHADSVRLLLDAGANKDATDKVCIDCCFSHAFTRGYMTCLMYVSMFHSSPHQLVYVHTSTYLSDILLNRRTCLIYLI